MSDTYAPEATAMPSWLDEALPPEKLAIGDTADDDYVEAAKPKVKELLEVADELLGEHQLRIGQAKEMNVAYDGGNPGHFLEDEDEITDGVIETMSIATLRQMLDFRCGLIAMHEPYPRLLNRDAIDRDEAMGVEELVMYLFRCEERQFARRYGADLRLAEPHHLCRYGMLVGLDVLDPADRSCGLSMQLIDPTTVFPVMGSDQGVEEVYRIYETTADRVAGAYGGKPGSDEYERIKGLLDNDAGKENTRTHSHTITECTNRDWMTVAYGDDKELFSRKHGYHQNPYTIVVGAFDLPAGVSSGTSSEHDSITINGTEIAINDRSVDLARLLRPFDWKRLANHRVAEAVAGRQLTEFKWRIDPPTVLELDPLQSKKQAPIDKLRPGVTNKVYIPGKLNIITPVGDPQTMAGLNMALAANAQTGIWGQMASGQVPPQTSGSALGAMTEQGGAADAVLVRLIQLFKQMRAEKRLHLIQTHGGMLGRQGDRGVISVPGRTGTRTPLHRVTPDMIERVGCQVEVELYNFRPDVAMAQFFTTLRAPHAVTGLPLVSDETARRHLKITPDPDREADRVEDERLLAKPAVQIQRDITRLETERDMALAEGDDDSADKAQSAILQLQYELEMLISSGGAAPAQGPPGGGMGMNQQQPPPVPEPPAPALPGNSLPEMGIGVGQQGGAPQQAPPAPTGNPIAPPAMSPVGGPSTY